MALLGAELFWILVTLLTKNSQHPPPGVAYSCLESDWIWFRDAQGLYVGNIQHCIGWVIMVSHRYS